MSMQAESQPELDASGPLGERFSYAAVPEAFMPFVRGPEAEKALMTPEAAAAAIWQTYGDRARGITSFEAYKEAKAKFSEEPRHEVFIRGGGPSGLLMARALRAADRSIHVTIIEKENRLGGMGVGAISPFVANHIDTVIQQQRLAMQVMMDPGVDVVTGYSVTDDKLFSLANILGAQAIVDSAGSSAQKMDIPYGPQVMTSNDFLWRVHEQYYADGHLGRVGLPYLRDETGKPYRTLIQAGGNQSRDLQVASEMVLLSDRVRRETMVDPRVLDVGKVGAAGIRSARLAMHLEDDPQLTTLLFYRGLDWKMKKLLSRVGSLEYGDPKLRAAMDAQLEAWEDTDGGLYVPQHSIVDVKTPEDGPMAVTVKNTATGSVTEVSAGLIVTAIRFESRPEIPGTVLVGIAVEGAADLSATGQHINKHAKGRVLERLNREHPVDPIDYYSRHRGTLFALQRISGTRNTSYDPVDPVLFNLERGPKHIIDTGFRTVKDAPHPRE